MSSATLSWMRHNGIPITRENWIALNYMEVRPSGRPSMRPRFLTS